MAIQWTSDSPWNPIVSVDTGSVTFSVYNDSGNTGTITWTSTRQTGTVSVTNPDTTGTSGTYSFTLTTTSGSFKVTAADSSDDTTITGVVNVLPSGWSDANVHMIEDYQGNVYAVCLQGEGVAPLPVQIYLSPVNPPQPDRGEPDVIAQANTVGGAVVDFLDDQSGRLSQSIMCYVLRLGSFPALGSNGVEGA